jgi:DNA processing protein
MCFIPVFHSIAEIQMLRHHDDNLEYFGHIERPHYRMKALNLQDLEENATARPRASKYTRPPTEIVRVVTLSDLISGTRSITPEQQTRFPSDDKLWCVGDTTLVRNKCVAIVGTRKVSTEGTGRARRLARELVAAGVVVVSGLAKGVDTEALSAAMQAGGRVVAVIGTPIDMAYPAENKHLQEQIYRDHLLVSQFPTGERVFRANFPERNKLMAALSDATAIIEAGDTSGTLHQAAECVRLGRWLFIAKSVVDDPSLQWPKRFLGQPRVASFSSTDDIIKAIK